MKANITDQQIDAWLAKRVEVLSKGDAELASSKAYALGILESTFRSLLNNPHQRADLVKEILAA